tara:strand:- start:7 stop:369 length:363 start_codon:yes stop_codon:yes gene_type:complete
MNSNNKIRTAMNDRLFGRLMDNSVSESIIPAESKITPIVSEKTNMSQIESSYMHNANQTNDNGFINKLNIDLEGKMRLGAVNTKQKDGISVAHRVDSAISDGLHYVDRQVPVVESMYDDE